MTQKNDPLPFKSELKFAHGLYDISPQSVERNIRFRYDVQEITVRGIKEMISINLLALGLQPKKIFPGFF
jgi:hypothetical protein